VKKLTQVELEALRSTVPYADLDDLHVEFVGKIEAADPTTLNEDLLAYARRFAKPISGRDRPCLACGEFMCGFVWGIVHGHGHCRECSWPAVLYHFIKDRDGKDLATIRGVLLQVHPDFVDVISNLLKE
jgi:hypothetical protein